MGGPISNTQAYVLDTLLNPCPLGVSGELYIGGDGLAREYVNRPDLTAERFVPQPYGSESGARLYKTGDLARRSPTGDIEFLGRADRQVKIRGFRVEPGEIEALLRGQPRVRDAALQPYEDRVGQKRLAAYVVPSEDGSPTHAELRSCLAEKLPGDP
jgi:acyl-coenzyme A synthetase/AMP-(fatty) acid ligase